MKNKAILVGICLLLSSCASIHNKSVTSDKPPLRVYIFDCGETDVDDLSLFAPGIGKNIKKKFAVSCYVIKHPKGLLLWDAGLDDEIALEKNGRTSANGKLHFRVGKPFLDQLAGINLNPKDFRYIAFSHFHADHVGNANAFKGITQFIQGEEFAAAFGKTPEQFRFNPDTYSELAHGPMIKLSGDQDVFGDGSVIIKRAIGHTPGHQVLFVDLPKTGPVLISGDLYHFTENREKKRIPSFNFDFNQTKKSMAAIEDFVQKTKATMWIEHDLEQNQTLLHAPDFYE